MKMNLLFAQGLIFLPIITAVLIYIFNKKLFNYGIFLTQLIMTGLVAKLWQVVLRDGPLDFYLGGWSKKIGVNLSIDPLALLFMTMAIIMWWAVMIYAWDQRKDDFKFIFFLIFLEGAFMAFLQVNDFFTLFVLMEILTITSAILILYKKDGLAIKAGLYYLLFNSFGMVVYLFGLLLLYLKAGTLNMDLIADYIQTTNFAQVSFSVLHVAFVFLFIAMCVKSALFPVYEWLPRAHTAAPASISALLSGLLVKSGLYGLIRIIQVFQVENLDQVLFYLGFLTALGGIVFAVSQSDIKATLAFSTISQIGLVVMAFASGTDLGHTGMYLHLFNHFLAKSILFLGAGVIINAYGYRRIREIRGIFMGHPFLSIAMFLAILSMVGAPLTAGFISKNIIKLSMLSDIQVSLYRVVGVGTLLVFIRFSKIFVGEPSRVNKIQVSQMLGISILTLVLGGAFFFQLPALDYFYSNSLYLGSAILKDTLAYISKTLYDGSYLIEFLIMAGTAYLIYGLTVKPGYKFWKTIRHFRINFHDAILSLLAFISIMLMVI